MILEIFKAAIHSVGTATTMTVAGVYLHRRGMITSETKTGMARYTQQIAIPALFFSKIVDCPQDFSSDQCPNILDHLGDAWVLLVWPLYVLAVGLLVGWLVIRITQPPVWQRNCVLAATAFANAMGMPITLLDVIGHNFQPPGAYNKLLDPSMFQSIYVILNPVLQWGLGGWLLANDVELPSTTSTTNQVKTINDGEHAFTRLRRNNFSIPSLEDAGFNSIRMNNPPAVRRNLYSIPSLEDAGFADERTGLMIQTRGTRGTDSPTTEISEQTPPISDDEEDSDSYYEAINNNTSTPSPQKDSTPNEILRVLSKIASKACQPPAVGAMLGFVVASYAPARGLFVDLRNRADNAPLEWIFDGILTLAKSAIPVNMCVVGVNLSIASQQRGSNESVDNKTILAVVLGKMLIMPTIGVLTVMILKTYFWDIPESIQFQFYLVLLMNFITPTANVVMVIAELGSGEAAKNVMASLIGYQYVVAPFLLSLTVMLCVWAAIM
uniref:Auxin efflux carrier n=1 Tax=Amphora coffeiformis TaxID=265554 RepID=A0A7S3P887_9STRA|mmetsp:Transcript_9464/g.18112  ORF Transcript_9464/g.18112 Transcript_9464/m.18112 type:complete len:495 (+) Transcript_9464:217-1701(+)